MCIRDSIETVQWTEGSTMEELKRRILSDAVVGEGDIIHVDMFLNHCMDINLMEHMGNALAKRFRGVRITCLLYTSRCV